MSIDKAIHLINEADSILIYSGSGMSADSGLPVFRGENGFWCSYPDLKEKRITFEDIANPQSFLEHPELALGFYGSRFNSYVNVAPHDGYRMLLELCKSKSHGYGIITSNVDGHFDKSGFENVYAIHGDINYWQCSDWTCSKKNELLPPPSIIINPDSTEAINLHDLICPNCNEKYIRPNVLMFNDSEFVSRRYMRQASLHNVFLDELHNKGRKVAILEIGAGVALPSIRIMAHKAALKFKTKTIRINPEDDFDATVELIQATAICGIKRIYENLRHI